MKRANHDTRPPLFLAVMLACTVFLAGWADDLESVKEKVESVHSIKAGFTQEKHLEMLNEPLVSEGMLYFSTPRSLRWEYTEPVRSVLLMHDEEIRRYVKSDSGMVEQKSQNLEAMRVFLREICMWMQGRFDANPDLNAEMKPGRKIVLQPENQAMAEVIRKIELRLTDRPGVIGSVAIYEDEASYTLIRFHDTKINTDISEAVFRKLNPDKNTRKTKGREKK